MSSGFISEAELAEQRRLRQEQWEKVRKPGQPEECPEEEYDHRSLFERLEEQKRKRELEYEEAHKLKNMIKGLDDDEVEFLDLVDRSKLEEERRKSAEEAREINDFRNAVASLQERSLEERIQSEIRTRPVTQTGSTGTRSSQMRLLQGAVVRKRPADATQEVDEKKARTENKTGSTSMNGNASMPSKKEESRTAASASSNSLQLKYEEESKSAELSKKRKNTDDKEENSDSSSLGLRCIGILPGLGSYPDSSDSEQSSDTDQEFNGSGTYDLVGRKVIRQSKSKSSSSVSR